jgi:polyhydroxyalkanoate synthesis regulator phasin
VTNRREGGNAEKEGIGELLRQVVLASMGAAAFGVDELEEFIRRARERGELTAADAQKLKDRLTEVLRGGPGSFDQMIEASLQSAFRKLSLPRRSEIERLRKSVETLAKRVEAMEKG